MTSPKVSVLVATYNAGTYLRPSLESILRQTYANLEILVIDDGSTDGCMDSIRDIADERVRIFRQANQGKPTAMNFALEQMRGEFYAMHDADDLSHPRRIELQLACLLEHPDVAAAYCGHELIIDGRHVAPTSGFKDAGACKQDIDKFRMPGHDPTGMYRCSLVRDFRYDPELLLGEGLDYILRIGEQFPMMVVGECLYSYRIHRQSITKQNPELRDRLVHGVLHRACVRRGLDFEKAFPHETAPRRGKSQHADNNLAASFIDSVLDQRQVGAIWGALHTGWTCSLLHPFELHYHKALIYALAPKWLARRLGRRLI